MIFSNISSISFVGCSLKWLVHERDNRVLHFAMTYNIPRFGDVPKIMLFKINLSIKVCLVCAEGQPGIEIRIREHSWLVSTVQIQRWSQNYQMSYGWKVHFWGNPLLHRFACNFNLFAFGTLFWKPSILLDLFGQVEPKFELCCWEVWQRKVRYICGNFWGWLILMIGIK